MRTPIATLAALTFCAPAIAVAADSYTVDPIHSAAIFKTLHFNVGYTYGMFRSFEGSLTVDAKKPERSSITLTIDAESVFTNSKKRDKHLRSPDFFNVKQHPKITFKSTRVRRSGKTWKVSGDFTMHGVTKNITLEVKQTGQGKDPYGNERIGFEGTFTLKRSAFGMNKVMGTAGDTVHLILSVEATKNK